MIYRFENHTFPVLIAFCPRKKDYAALMSEIGISGQDAEYPQAPGNMVEFFKTGMQTRLVLTFSKECERRDSVEVMGLMAHECMHVVQYTARVMGTKFDDETEAYFIQALLMWLITSYADAGRGFKP